MRKKLDYIAIFFLFIIYVYVVCITFLPNEVTLFGNEELNLKTILGVNTSQIATVSNENINKTKVEVNLFGLVNVKDIDVISIDNYKVVPVGKIIGLKLYTNGVLIVGMTEVENINNIKLKPYETENIKEGDTIIKVNNIEVTSIEDLQKIINSSSGKEVELTLVRNGEILTCKVLPAEVEKNQYKLGLWVKDAATGVGTISFYEPETKRFAALGHGITDSDTDRLIDIDSGEIVTSKIISIQKSESGEAGELKGSIAGQGTIGEVEKNTQFGIFGKLNNLSKLNIDVNESFDVALRNEIQLGKAKIRCTLDEGITKDYDIEIERVFINNNENNKSMQIKIIDPELMEKTGGIIRGLSGAPIIQNNKFIGAVTNVLVNDPQRGYAIFGDMMVKELINEND